MWYVEYKTIFCCAYWFEKAMFANVDRNILSLNLLMLVQTALNTFEMTTPNRSKGNEPLNYQR